MSANQLFTPEYVDGSWQTLSWCHTCMGSLCSPGKLPALPLSAQDPPANATADLEVYLRINLLGFTPGSTIQAIPGVRLGNVLEAKGDSKEHVTLTPTARCNTDNSSVTTK